VGWNVEVGIDWAGLPTSRAGQVHRAASLRVGYEKTLVAASTVSDLQRPQDKYDRYPPAESNLANSHAGSSRATRPAAKFAGPRVLTPGMVRPATYAESGFRQIHQFKIFAKRLG
jgi:hypothetical protein